MFTIRKSALFMQQWRSYAQHYRDGGGINVAQRFIGAVEAALSFIRQTPYACSIYDTGEGYEDLRMYQFRKWNLHVFPHMVLFRLGDNGAIFIEALYAHKMDIPSRLATDINSGRSDSPRTSPTPARKQGHAQQQKTNRRRR
jgi:ParE toxin of type II toxin-antitoxin system, parDE